MSCINCDNGFEIRIEPETLKPYALACRSCKPYLRKIQLTKQDNELALQDQIVRRANMLKDGDRNAI